MPAEMIPDPVPYDPASKVPGATWLKLASRVEGYYLLVSDEDLPFLGNYRWTVDHPGRQDTAGERTHTGRTSVRKANGRTTAVVNIMRFVLGLVGPHGENLQSGLWAIVLNGNRWDIRRGNIAVCPQASLPRSAKARRHGRKKDGDSRAGSVAGVTYEKRYHRWRLEYGGKMVGYYRSEVEAVEAKEQHIKAERDSYFQQDPVSEKALIRSMRLPAG